MERSLSAYTEDHEKNEVLCALRSQSLSIFGMWVSTATPYNTIPRSANTCPVYSVTSRSTCTARVISPSAS